MALGLDLLLEGEQLTLVTQVVEVRGIVDVGVVEVVVLDSLWPAHVDAEVEVDPGLEAAAGVVGLEGAAHDAHEVVGAGLALGRHHHVAHALLLAAVPQDTQVQPVRVLLERGQRVQLGH